MDLREVTTFQSPQCPLLRQQHDREQASSPPALTQILPAITAKNTDPSRMTVENSKERRNKNATKAGYQEGISKMSDLGQNEPTGGTVLERRRSPPQAQKQQIRGRQTRR